MIICFICFMEIKKIEGNGRNELFYFERKIIRQVSIPDWRVNWDMVFDQNLLDEFVF